MATPDKAISTEIKADPRCAWTPWSPSSSEEVAQLVAEFEPLDAPAGHNATAWLKGNARTDIFTVTHLLLSEARLEGFITCRVSEATLTWSGVESLGVSREEARKQVPAYLLCWCAKHRDTEIDGDELVFNAIRLGREVSQYGCVVLALDPHDDECADKVWLKKHAFRKGAVPEQPGKSRLWTPLSAD